MDIIPEDPQLTDMEGEQTKKFSSSSGSGDDLLMELEAVELQLDTPFSFKSVFSKVETSSKSKEIKDMEGEQTGQFSSSSESDDDLEAVELELDPPFSFDSLFSKAETSSKSEENKVLRPELRLLDDSSESSSDSSSDSSSESEEELTPAGTSSKSKGNQDFLLRDLVLSDSSYSSDSFSESEQELIPAGTSSKSEENKGDYLVVDDGPDDRTESFPETVPTLKDLMDTGAPSQFEGNKGEIAASLARKKKTVRFSIGEDRILEEEGRSGKPSWDDSDDKNTICGCRFWDQEAFTMDNVKHSCIAENATHSDSETSILYSFEPAEAVKRCKMDVECKKCKNEFETTFIRKGDNMWACGTCGNTFPLLVAMSNHMNSHLCESCKNTIELRRVLRLLEPQRKFLRIEMLGLGHFPCVKCNKRFRRMRWLKFHCLNFCHIKGHACV